MRITRNLEFQTGSKEEKLPYETTDFPYVASQAELDDYREPFVPWHWHNAIELFYMESGQLKYHTPNETMVFSAGWAGMMNSNVLHMTEIQTHKEKNIQLLHIFEPKLLAGDHGSRIEQKYIMSIITSSQIEIIPLSPMGSMGSDIAIDAADVALMSDDISKIPYLKWLSNTTVKTIKFSIALSMCINFVAILMSLMEVLTPTTGALVHNAGSCLVVLIAALLYDRKYKQ